MVLHYNWLFTNPVSSENLPQAKVEIGSLGLQASILPIEPPLLVVIEQSYNFYVKLAHLPKKDYNSEIPKNKGNSTKKDMSSKFFSNKDKK